MLLILFTILSGLFLVLAGILIVLSPGKIDPYVDAEGKPKSGSISEKTFVNIGSVNQGMFLKSRDINKPILLYVHGGPAFPNYFLIDKFKPGLEDYFTVCYWEQRGGGLSYTPEVSLQGMNFNQLATDAIEVTNYLRKRFGKEKIYIMAHSGGTPIGMLAVSREPTLFFAYIGMGQITNQAESEKLLINETVAGQKYIINCYRGICVFFVYLYMEKNTQQLSFSSISVSKRKIKSKFFDQMNQLLDWSAIDKEIRQYYNKGFSASGRRSYSGLVLFKMSLLQTWYGLSDYEVEERVNDSLSFMKFVGLTLEDDVPDHSILSRFRTELTKKDAYEKLMGSINGQLETKGILLKKGAIVDASITDSPRKPKGKKEYEVVEDRKEEAVGDGKVAGTVPALKIQSHVDTEGAWIKKAGKLRYGYKKHVATDEQGLVRSVVTTAANESDIVHLEDVIEKAGLDKGSRVRADKGYSSGKNREYLKKNRLKDGIMHKAARNKPLSSHQQKLNKIISKTRFKVERTFGGIKLWFKAGTTRYLGKAKTHTQHMMEAIAYNLYRSPGIIMSNANSSAK